jgi:signal transduction histidine kinase
MRAMQSRIALEIIECKEDLGQVAALHHRSRALELGCDEHPTVCQPLSQFSQLAPGAGLAHDAGNLLGALRLYSQLLAMPGVLHEEYKKYATELQLLSERSWAMIDRLVNHAQNVAEGEVSATVLPEVVERCRGLLDKIAGRKVEILWNAGGFQPVNVPAEAVERIVTNLVKNAAEATLGEGVILVSVKGLMASGVRRVVMTVSDSGCGMSAATLKTLRDGGMSRVAGRGIGFRVVRELAATSGGCLEIASEPRVGTSVSVEWTALMQNGSAAVPQVAGGRITRKRGTKTVMKAEAGWIAC